MSKMIKLSQDWLTGFVKHAEAVGYTQAQAVELLKLAQRLQIQRDHPQSFDNGVAEVTQEKQAGPRLLALLGLLGLGGAATMGGKRLAEGAVKDVTNYGRMTEMDKYIKTYGEQAAWKRMQDQLPGMNAAV